MVVVVVVEIRVVVVIVAVVWMLMNHLSSFALSRKRPHVQIQPIQRMRFRWTDRRMDQWTDGQTDNGQTNPYIEMLGRIKKQRQLNP